MRGSGTRCSTTSVTCPPPSRSTACTTRARSPRSSTSTTAACTSRPTTWRRATARSSTTDSRWNAATGRMGKSRKNMVTPDEIYRDYGADTLRLYEMFMGPLDADRVWSTADIAGVYRFLQRFWRNVVDEDTGELHMCRPTRPTTTRGGCCTARSTPCAPTWERSSTTPRSRGSSSSTTISRRWWPSRGARRRKWCTRWC